MGGGRRKCYKDFSLKMSSSLSKRWVCFVVENLSRVFLSEYPLIFLWVMRVYIVWVKGKKVTFKILQVERFMSISWEGLTRETLAKLTAWHDSSASSHVLLICPFHGNLSRELLASQSQNCTNSSFHARFFTNLILNPI